MTYLIRRKKQILTTLSLSLLGLSNASSAQAETETFHAITGPLHIIIDNIKQAICVNVPQESTDKIEKYNPFDVGVKHKIIGSAFALALFRYLSKIPNAKPVRYNWQKITNGEDLANQAWYLIDDGLIGQADKRSSVRADPESGKVWCSKEVPPKGIFGYAHVYWKPLLGAIGGYYTAVGLLNLENSKKFIKDLIGEKWEKPGKVSLEKLAHIILDLLKTSETASQPTSMA